MIILSVCVGGCWYIFGSKTIIKFFFVSSLGFPRCFLLFNLFPYILIFDLQAILSLIILNTHTGWRSILVWSNISWLKILCVNRCYWIKRIFGFARLNLNCSFGDFFLKEDKKEDLWIGSINFFFCFWNRF